MCEGKSFHIHASVTGKVRRPTVESLTAGTDRLSVIEDQINSLLRQSVIHVTLDRSANPLSKPNYMITVHYGNIGAECKPE